MLGYIITIVLAGLQVSRAYADQHNVTYLACLENSDCWLKHDFTYDDNWNSCHGDQYVTKYKGYYVGVILCSSSRYKIFMSESLSDKFLNIADDSGHGQDHCQFVGAASESQANLPGDFWSSPIGYYRSKWGDDIRKGNIGRLPTSTGKYYVKWYECQVEIPGSRVVLTNFNVFDHIPTTAVPSTSPSTNRTATSSPTSPTTAVPSTLPSTGHTATSSPTSPTTAVPSTSPSTSHTATSSPTSHTTVSNITRHTSPSCSNSSYQTCLNSPNCWLKYAFTFEDNWNSCHGDQYIIKYGEHYVGVVLCSSTRYKLFMSESLSDKFLNIADGSGHGQDHCQFVGAASESQANLPGDFCTSPTTTGYFRYKWSDLIVKGRIGGSPSWTGKYYVKWYECGVTIPGRRQVVEYMDKSSPTTSPTSTTSTTLSATTAMPRTCTLSTDSPTASATHPRVRYYSTRSCTLCTTPGEDEVHVINMYEPTGSHSGSQQKPTNIVSVPVEIKSAVNTTVNIKLVLMTYNAADWVITKPDNVHIQAVTLASYYYTLSTVNLQNNVTKDWTYISGWRKISKLKTYVTGLYGHMNSYTGVYHAPSWVLNVGSC